jgi:PDZ domain-containing protein
MSQRRIAALLAVPLLGFLLVAPLVVTLPYVEYEPGLTVDVLGEKDGEEIVQVSGHPAYRDDGELRLTTVFVTPPEGGVDLYTALDAWIDDEKALLPYEIVYPDGETPEDADRRGAAQMVDSQDTAVAAALVELGYEVDGTVQVQVVDEEMPAAGKLKARDQLLRIGDTPVETPQDVVDAVSGAPAGEPLEFRVRREGAIRTIEVAPRENDGRPMIGIVPGVGYDFPFDVSLTVDPDIGGPSAGLMFSLAVYDTLTPGSLTQGRAIAGTGTIDEQGEVGPIGGIQQKIVGAREDGAELFLVPPGNCEEALGAPADGIRIARADDLTSAVDTVESWSDDPDAELPTCEDVVEEPA